MGSFKTYKCDKCDYHVETCGDLDQGRMAVLRPYICKYCKIVTDVLVGEVGMEIHKEILHMLNKDDKNNYYKCDQCNGENIYIWNTKSRESVLNVQAQ